MSGLFTNTRTRCGHNEREILLINETKLSALIKISSSLSGQQVRLFVNKTQTETVSNPFYKQLEFTALQGTINDFTSLKQE